MSAEGQPRIVVIGATGNVGAATVRYLSTLFGDVYSIVAGARNPESDGAKKLAELPGVTAEAATMGDTASVSAIAKDAFSVFIVTPPTEDRAALAAKTAEDARAAGAKDLVIVSVAAADDDSILFGRQFKELEARVAALSPTLLRLPMFLDNLWGQAGGIKEGGKFYLPADPSQKTSQVAVKDVGEAAARVLAKPEDHRGKTYTLISDTFTHTELAAALSEATGKTVEHVQVPGSAGKDAMVGMGMPEWQAAGVVELYDLINAGRGAVGATDLVDLLPRAPTSIAAWATENAAGFK